MIQLMQIIFFYLLILCTKFSASYAYCLENRSGNENGLNIVLQDDTDTELVGVGLSEEFTDTFQILDSMKKTNIANNENVVLLLGATGTGISTLTQIIAGDHLNLTVYVNDLNELVIQDKGNLIGSGFYSHTTYPNMVHVNNTLFIDLPGLGVEQSSLKGSANVITSYVINQVLQKSCFVKIIIIFEANFFESRKLTADLIHFFRRLKSLLPNISEYKSGLMAVINKINAEDSNIEYYANFFRNLQSVNKVKDTPLQLYIQDIVNIFTANINGVYSKLTGMSVPGNVKTSFSDYGNIQAQKHKIRYILNNKLLFVDKREAIVGYPLTQEATLKVITFFGVLKQRMTQIIKSFALSLKTRLQEKSENIKDLKKLIKTIQTQIKELQALRGYFDMEVFTGKLKSTLRKLNISVSEYLLQELDVLNERRNFLNKTISHQYKMSKYTWYDSIDELVRVPERYNAWFIFLRDLYDKLSSYPIQRKLDLYNVKNINDWGKPNKPQGLIIHEGNFNLFLDKMISYFFKHETQLWSVKDQTSSSVKISLLNQIIEKSLNSAINKTTRGSTVFIASNNMVLSKVLRSLINFDANITVVALVATNNIYIDCNWTSNTNISIGIFANNWVVTDKNLKIKLIGKSGTDFNSTADKGQDGLPGLPGENGGNFLGIGNIIEGRKLTIASLGGRGGDGENGGKGKDGISKIGRPLDNDFSCKISMGFASDQYERFLVFHPQACGDKGGNGGAGGMGGNAGRILIKSLQNQDHNLTIELNEGRVGKNGTGGSGGFGGPNQLILPGIYDHIDDLWGYGTVWSIPVYNAYPPGMKGIDGGNSIGIILSKPSHTLKMFQTSLQMYEEYLFLRKNDIFLTNEIYDTQFKLSTDKEIINIHRMQRL